MPKSTFPQLKVSDLYTGLPIYIHYSQYTYSQYTYTALHQLQLHSIKYIYHTTVVSLLLPKLP